ncbi:unnamed protein product, partial [Iphiclides podalirius]
MANYAYNYPPQFSQMLPPNAEYASQGDGLREYCEMGNSKVKETKRSFDASHTQDPFSLPKPVRIEYPFPVKIKITIPITVSVPKPQWQPNG